MIEVLSQHIPGRKQRNISDRIVVVPVRDSKRALPEYKFTALLLDRLVRLEDIIKIKAQINISD
jgi:hypothetical protein